MDDVARKELSNFLKTRRARLTPAEAGLAPRGNRRGGGLRREEVAVLAGVGLTWYTWLEQGREIQVSTPFLENIARALRLSNAERVHLFALTQRRPPPVSSPAVAADALALDNIQPILDAIDSPAYARDSRFDVLAWNRANTETFGDFALVPDEQRNVIRLMFSRPRYRRTMPNWEADARSLVAKFRVNFGHNANDPRFVTFLDEMIVSNDDFRRIWAEHAVSDPGEGVYLYRSGRHGALAFQHSTVMPEARPDLRIVIYIRVQIPE